MPAKKKAAKVRSRKPNPVPVPSLERQVEALANALMSDPRLAAFITGGGACDVAQRALVTLAAERDEARKELAVARRGREAWCHTAVNLELRAEKAEEQLKVLLAGITAQRPSVSHVGTPGPPPGSPLAGPSSREPGPTYGLPGDAPLPGRFSREFRG